MRILRTEQAATSPTGPTGLPALPPRRSPHRWLPTVFVLIGAIVLADALIGEQSLSSGQNARLREEARRLREDPDTIEYLARKDLGLARRGEILVVVK